MNDHDKRANDSTHGIMLPWHLKPWHGPFAHDLGDVVDPILDPRFDDMVDTEIAIGDKPRRHGPPPVTKAALRLYNTGPFIYEQVRRPLCL